MTIRSVHIQTLGCRLNQSESERFAQGFSLLGYKLVARAAQADIVVLNTCTVTDRAARDSVKASKPDAKSPAEQILVVTGCHSEIAPEDFKAVILVPSKEKDLLVQRVATQFPAEMDNKSPSLVSNVFAGRDLQMYPLVLKNTRAFVKIQDGCDLSCSYCMTTIARGNSTSRDAGAIVEEVYRLHEQGCQEIVLTGVHAASYGKDSEARAGRGPQIDLGQLIRLLLDETDIGRIRLSSLEPWNLDTTWLKLWADNPERLCDSFHISLQSGSDSVLKRMRRAYTSQEYAEKLAIVREYLPNAGITTDIICGFPGETENEHQQSLAFINQQHFAGAHVFTYSERPGTKAADLLDDVPGNIKKARRKEIVAATNESSTAFLQAQVGKRLNVLWEKSKDGQLHGLSGNYLNCVRPQTNVRQTNILEPRTIQLVANAHLQTD